MIELLLVAVCALIGAGIVHFAGPELIGACFGGLIGIVLVFVNNSACDSNRLNTIWKLFEFNQLKVWLKNH